MAGYNRPVGRILDPRFGPAGATYNGTRGLSTAAKSRPVGISDTCDAVPVRSRQHAYNAAASHAKDDDQMTDLYAVIGNPISI